MTPSGIGERQAVSHQMYDIRIQDKPALGFDIADILDFHESIKMASGSCIVLGPQLHVQQIRGPIAIPIPVIRLVFQGSQRYFDTVDFAPYPYDHGVILSAVGVGHLEGEGDAAAGIDGGSGRLDVGNHRLGGIDRDIANDLGGLAERIGGDDRDGVTAIAINRDLLAERPVTAKLNDIIDTAVDLDDDLGDGDAGNGSGSGTRNGDGLGIGKQIVRRRSDVKGRSRGRNGEVRRERIASVAIVISELEGDLVGAIGEILRRVLDKGLAIISIGTGFNGVSIGFAGLQRNKVVVHLQLEAGVVQTGSAVVGHGDEHVLSVGAEHGTIGRCTNLTLGLGLLKHADLQLGAIRAIGGIDAGSVSSLIFGKDLGLVHVIRLTIRRRGRRSRDGRPQLSLLVVSRHEFLAVEPYDRFFDIGHFFFFL